MFDHSFGRVWTDGTTPCLFAQVVRVPRQAELDDLAEKQVALIKELKRRLGDVYSILDLRLCPVLPAHIIQHYIANLVPLQFEVGLKHKAFVAPEEKAAREVFEKALLLIDNRPISQHLSFEKALAKINQLRTQEKNSGERNPTATFLQALYEKLT